MEYFNKIDEGINMSVDMIQSRVGNEGKVIVLVSGGVDSMVTAALLLAALPAENIYAIHVDHGFMRKNESDFVFEQLKKLGFKNLLRVDAKDKFLHTKVEIDDGVFAGPLIDVTDPETKRQIIGSLFIEVVREAADTLELDYDKTFIAQGTLKPDLIESANTDLLGGDGDKNRIKTHHNDVDIVRKARAKGLIIETNWNWYKEDVRQAARRLGIAEEIASRQPFPGPGLAVRQICSNKNILAEPNGENRKSFDNLMKSLNINGLVAPILSVGVQGEARSYKNLAVLFGDGLDADFGKISEAAAVIPEKLDFINRCVYVLNKKNIESDGITCGELTMAEENTNLLREIDHIVTSEITKFLKGSGNLNKITQYFGVLTPIQTIQSAGNQYAAVIRAFLTVDYMTGMAAVPGKDIPVEVIRAICGRIEKELDKIGLILYDLTGKPPATMEWE